MCAITSVIDYAITILIPHLHRKQLWQKDLRLPIKGMSASE